MSNVKKTIRIKNSKRKSGEQKGGTVVPPSKFHFESTEDVENQYVKEKTPRPHASARMHASAMKLRKLNILIACEESQAECSAFRELGHNAYSCDIQLCRPSGHPEWHIRDDVRPYLRGLCSFRTQDGERHQVQQWDLIIAHPPCTFLCKLSSCQLYKPPTKRCEVLGKTIEANWTRVEGLLKGREFFYECLSAKAPFVAVENPIPMALAKLPRPDCYADPSWYGVKYTKKTCYWLKNLPPLMAECAHTSPKCYVDASRGKYRSRTFPQMAKAIAKQWSEYILDDLNNNPQK